MVRRFTDRAAVKPAPPHRLDAVPARVTPGVIRMSHFAENELLSPAIFGGVCK
jgi:hypothetical protein